MISFAQTQNSSLKPLKVGDYVPGFAINNTINYSGKSIRLTDFKNKLLILDFWTFNCSACVMSWPKLLSMQKEFGEKIQIVLINNQQKSKDAIDKFVLKHEKLNNYKMSLPMIYDDIRLDSIFPHSAVPFVIFVDQGMVKSIPYPTFLNRETIKQIIEGKEPKLVENASPTIMGQSRPLFIDGFLTPDTIARILSSSIITPYRADFIPVADFGSKAFIDGRAY